MEDQIRQHRVQSPVARFQFIDLLRGWAVFVMIETHVVNALLHPEIKKQTFFTILSFINGLVAPSFLFCAGFALAITLERKWNDYITLRHPFWRYLLRIGFILIVGYSLHLPFFSLSKLRTVTDVSVWIPFFQADILQTISITLFALVLIAVIFRGQKIFLIVSAFIALMLVYTAPVVRDLDYSTMVEWLRPYFSNRYKSQFPLFPWSAFLIGGTIIGFWYLNARRRNGERRFIGNIIVLGMAAIIISMIAEFLPLTIYPYHKFWRASPEFFFVRFGLVVLALAGLWLYEQRRKVSARSVFALFGKESLLVYVAHLLIVYGYTYQFSFVRIFGPTLDYAECFGLFIGLTIVMGFTAYVWNSLRRISPAAVVVIRTLTLAVIVLTFFLQPG